MHVTEAQIVSTESKQKGSGGFNSIVRQGVSLIFGKLCMVIDMVNGPVSGKKSVKK
jgi:hypothetical protein